MPFSSVLGASSVIKPGVCTSTTRPTVPYEGQLIYETDTDMVAAYNGSAWFYTHSSGLVLISSTTIGNAVSSVTVSSAFSSTYDNYLIIVGGGVASGGAIHLNLTLGATATGYYYGGSQTAYPTGTVSGVAGNNATSFAQAGHGSTSTLDAYVVLRGPNLAKRTAMTTQNARTAAGEDAYQYSGFLNDTTQYTAFTFTTSSGTITGGTIRVYGYKN